MKKRLFCGILALTLLLTLSPARAAGSRDALRLVTEDNVDAGGRLGPGEGNWFWGGEQPGYGPCLFWRVPRDRLEWARSVDGTPAALTLDGLSCTGTLSLGMPEAEYVLAFLPDAGAEEPLEQAVEKILMFLAAPEEALPAPPELPRFGDGPELSARMTLNGAVVSGPLTGDELPGAWCWRNYEDGGGSQAWSYLHWVVPQDRVEWAATMAWVPALLDFDGVEIPGNLAYADDLPNFRGPVLRFYPDVTDDRVAQRVADRLRFPQGTGFADVDCHDWFAPYVQVCVERGLMEGTGEGRFEPGKPLSDPECLTLALRLYDLCQGGTGALKKAPEDLGEMVLTLADGTEITGYQGDNDPFWCWSYHGALSKHIQPPGATLEEQEAWCRAHEGPAALAAAGQVWQGQTALYYTPAGHGREVVLDFTPAPEDREAMSQVIREGLLYEGVPGPRRWWRDAAYTREMLEDETVRRSMSDLTGDSEALTTRWEFTGALAGAAGELEKRNSIPALPDLDRERHNEGRYGLYEAGVLSGVDKYGSLAGGRSLTRAEAAAMAARVLEPSLRLTFTPADYSPFLAAGLTPETVMFEDGTTAEDFLREVNSLISSAEYGAKRAGYPFSWDHREPGGQTTLERITAQALADLGITGGLGTRAYLNFDLPTYYSRLIEITGKSFEPDYAVGVGA